MYEGGLNDLERHEGRTSKLEVALFLGLGGSTCRPVPTHLHHLTPDPNGFEDVLF
jgi:hypothetical protein